MRSRRAAEPGRAGPTLFTPPGACGIPA